MKYINNGEVNKVIKYNETLPEGFVYGRLPSTDATRKILSDAHKGKRLSQDSINKMLNTFKDRYGVNSCSQLPGVGDKISDKLSSKEVQEKIKNTCIEKYGVESVLQDKQILQKKLDTTKERYGDYFFPNKEKEYETRKQNGTLGNYETYPERYIKQMLIQRFGEDDIITQYMSKQYPFKSDFYIKSLDLYIEYHGFWTHGGKPFDKNNEEDLSKLNMWKERDYKNAIYTWTDLDVRKNSYKDKVNLIIFYPEEQYDIVYSFKKLEAELDSYVK